jgi:hypothetical protein
MVSKSRLELGDHIVLRGVWRRRLWWAIPVTVVQDKPDLIALYWPSGAPDKNPEKRLTPRDLLSTKRPDLVERKWGDTNVLMLATPGEAHAVYAMWEAEHNNFDWQ